MFLLPSGSSKSLCLIWSRTLAFRESDNGKRCYETKHKSFEKTYLHKSEPWALTSSSMQKKQKKLTIVLKYHTDMMYFIQFWQSYRYNYWALNHSRLDVLMFSLLTGAPETVSATRSLSLSLSSSGHLVFTAVHCLCHNSGALFQLIFNGRPWCWSMEQFVALSLQESSGCSPWPKGHRLLIPQWRNYHLQDREVIALRVQYSSSSSGLTFSSFHRISIHK